MFSFRSTVGDREESDAGNSITLRPEGTVGVVRAVSQSKGEILFECEKLGVENCGS